ncbi:MAG: HEPN domain-containing protein [Leptolyngbya sp. Prado105]|jgi:uncharacterized protein (UPF0332 family)|nr:HEPN domain-containing protein [Leptolyngbya sp. Prado105]
MTQDISSLLHKARQSLTAAKLLADEGLFEFSVSRAYYTMFYIAQALLLSRELSFSTHAGVINAFGLQFAKSGEIAPEYHQALIKAERLRLQGDYDVEPEISAESSEKQIDWATRFIQLAEARLEGLET